VEGAACQPSGMLNFGVASRFLKNLRAFFLRHFLPSTPLLLFILFVHYQKLYLDHICGVFVLGHTMR
jgi:hypothetical protein